MSGQFFLVVWTLLLLYVNLLAWFRPEKVAEMMREEWEESNGDAQASTGISIVGYRVGVVVADIITGAMLCKAFA